MSANALPLGPAQPAVIRPQWVTRRLAKAIPGGPDTWLAENSPEPQIEEDCEDFEGKGPSGKMASKQIRC